MTPTLTAAIISSAQEYRERIKKPLRVESVTFFGFDSGGHPVFKCEGAAKITQEVPLGSLFEDAPPKVLGECRDWCYVWAGDLPGWVRAELAEYWAGDA